MNETPLRVGIYLRLSDEDRDKENRRDDSESIKNQRHMLMEEIDRRPELSLVDEYCDEDLSGAGTYRPEFERLIEDCEKGKIDVVLCKSQSRFSRDMEVIEKYLHNKFIEWGVRFISLADNADTDNSGNKKARQINGLVNEWYLEDVSNNIRSAFKAKMQQGEFISPFASFGYEVSPTNNNKLVIDPVAAAIVKDIYSLYLKGLGFTGIAKYLNDKNIPSPSLYKYQKGSKLNIISNRPREKIKWSTNAIKTILTNELYLGHLIQGKRTTISYKNHKIVKRDKREWIRSQNTHEAIIDEETFKRVQTAISERTKPIKVTGIAHLFSGKTFCLECKRYMRKKNSSRHEYLVCTNNRDGYDNCHNKSSMRYDVLEELMREAINKKIEKYLDKSELNNINDEYMNRFNSVMTKLIKQKERIESERAQTKKYLKLLYEDRLNGIITIDQFKDLAKTYDKEEKTYDEQLRDVDKKINEYERKENDFNVEILFNKYQKIEELNKFIVDQFIDKIYIGKINNLTNTRYIQIKWNFH